MYGSWDESVNWYFLVIILTGESTNLVKNGQVKMTENEIGTRKF